MKKKIAVILAGAGARDGSDIQESVLLLYAISKAGADYEVFSINEKQFHSINHNTGEEYSTVDNYTRNCLEESARISRGGVKEIETLSSNDFDALMMPGGMGSAKNIFNFALKMDSSFTVDPRVAKVIMDFYNDKKPIGGMCISPVMLSKTFIDNGITPKVTFGDVDSKALEIMSSLGVKTEKQPASGVCKDDNLKLYTTPCYMCPTASIKDIGLAAENLVDSVLKASMV